jgi:RsiW-degrading membrane proteinase PrsW (M82 family)
MAICLIGAYIGGFIDIAAAMPEGETSIFLSPIIEEIIKFLPILFYMLIFLPGNRDLLLFAVGIGAGFATFENCCYILSSGADSLPYVMIRGLAVGVMHIVCTFVLSMALVLLRNFKVISFAGIVGALSLSMSFHGLYNLLVSEPGLSSYIGYAMPLLSAVILYLPYKRSFKNL